MLTHIRHKLTASDKAIWHKLTGTGKTVSFLWQESTNNVLIRAMWRVRKAHLKADYINKLTSVRLKEVG